MSSSDRDARAAKALSVCFHRPNAYGVFFPRSARLFGGADIRAHRFATELATRPGFDVSFIVAYERQPERLRVGDVTTVRSPFERTQYFLQGTFDRYRKALEAVGRSRWLRWARRGLDWLWQAPLSVVRRRRAHGEFVAQPRPFYQDQRADVFCCFGANEQSSDIIASGKTYGFKTILFLVAQHEASAEVAAGEGRHSVLAIPCAAIRHAVTHADAVVVQTKAQAEDVRSHFRRDAVLIRNPIDVSLPRIVAADRPTNYVFWIGRTAAPEIDHKRPDLCLELARRCPEIPFFAVINPFDQDRFQRLLATRPENLTITEQVAFDEIEDYFRRSAFHVSTSSTEGFPNAFLQAAKYSRPTISLRVDPDGMLAHEGCGIVCDDDLERMAAEIRAMWHEPARAAAFGRRAREYVEREHDMDKSVDRLAALLVAATRPS